MKRLLLPGLIILTTFLPGAYCNSLQSRLDERLRDKPLRPESAEEVLDLDKENRFSEQFLTEKFRSATQSYLNDVQVAVHAPNRLDIWANWAGIPLNLPLTLELENKKPHFYLTEINDTPLFLIADNISAGVNRGIDHAFQKGPVDVSSLEVQDGVVVFTIEPSGRAPFVKPTPVLTAGPTPTSTPVNLTLVAVFNDLDQDIVLEIEGETWHILANDTKVIEKEPGTYNIYGSV